MYVGSFMFDLSVVQSAAAASGGVAEDQSGSCFTHNGGMST